MSRQGVENLRQDLGGEAAAEVKEIREGEVGWMKGMELMVEGGGEEDEGGGTRLMGKYGWVVGGR